MTIFVTGATGLLGSFICRRLLEHGYAVRALRRPTSRLSLLEDIHDQITWVEGDILDTVLLTEQLAGAEAVVHCAALVSYDSRHEAQMHKVNVEGTANLVNASLRLGIDHFLHVSSVAAIGRGKDQARIDETHQANAEEFGTAYARSKHLAELEVWRASSEGLPVAIVNPSLVLGPGEWDQSSTKIFKYIWDENRFYVDGLANYVDVRDVATVVLRLLKARTTGERFITSAGSVSYVELFATIAQSFNKKPPGTRVNPRLIPLASVADSLRARLTGRPPLITSELQQIATNSHVFDSTKVQQTTGITFNPLENTVRWCCHELAKKNQMVQS
ncbi:MAG: NAD-dependent epimerase/dehydratase family protein [Tunicatimonas sp.]